MPAKLDAPEWKNWLCNGVRVPAWQLDQVIEEVLPLLCKEAEFGQTGGNDEQGGLDLLAQRTSVIDDASANSIVRKLYDIRRGKRLTSDVTFADAMLMSLGKSFASAGVAVIPGSYVAAKEMVETHADVRDDGTFYTGMKTPKQLVKSLLNFSYGFCFCDADVVEVAEEEEVAA